MPELVLSQYAYLFPNEKALGIFHTLRVEAHFIPHDRLSGIENIKTREDFLALVGQMDDVLVRQLTDARVLVRDSTDEITTLQAKVVEVTGVPKIHIAYFIPTTRCNLACRYCFFEDRMPEDDTIMDVATAKRALDLFASWAVKDRSSDIIVYGGEPLLAQETTKFIVQYASQLIRDAALPFESNIMILTNGTRVDESFAKFLCGYRDHTQIGVSLDGPKKLHDTWRVSYSGAGSYDRALRGFRLLQEVGVDPSISVTLPPSNLPYINEIIDWTIDLGVGSLSFNSIVDTAVMQVGNDYAVEVAKAMLVAFERFREVGIYEDRVMRKVNAFTDGKILAKDCAGCGEQIVIAPDGQVGICHGHVWDRKDFGPNVNDIGDFNPGTDPVFQSWNGRTPLNMSQCTSCPALGICGGGCARNAETRYGSIWEIDDSFCPHSEMTLAWLMRQTHDSMFLTD